MPEGDPETADDGLPDEIQGDADEDDPKPACPVVADVLRSRTESLGEDIAVK